MSVCKGRAFGVKRSWYTDSSLNPFFARNMLYLDRYCSSIVHRIQGEMLHGLCGGWKIKRLYIQHSLREAVIHVQVSVFSLQVQ